MKIKISEVTKIRATGERFDPVSIILEDISAGCGKLTVECFGDAWAFLWGAIGGGEKIRGFLLSADTDYITTKLCRESVWTTDYAKIEKEAGVDISDHDLSDADHAALANFYGEDWVHDIPSCYSREYDVVTDLVEIVKRAIKLEAGEATA